MYSSAHILSHLNGFLPPRQRLMTEHGAGWGLTCEYFLHSQSQKCQDSQKPAK